METDDEKSFRLHTEWGHAFMDIMDKHCTSPDPRQILKPLSPREQLLVIYVTLDGDVCNGGFHYYLCNTSGRLLAPAQQILKGICEPDFVRVLHDVEQLIEPDAFYFYLTAR